MIECWQPDDETFSSCIKRKCEAEWGKGFNVEVKDWHWADLSDNIRYGAVDRGSTKPASTNDGGAFFPRCATNALRITMKTRLKH